jgi:hypothetical protein
MMELLECTKCHKHIEHEDVLRLYRFSHDNRLYCEDCLVGRHAYLQLDNHSDPLEWEWSEDDDIAKRVRSDVDELTALRARVAELEAALRPFADAYEKFNQRHEELPITEWIQWYCDNDLLEANYARADALLAASAADEEA